MKLLLKLCLLYLSGLLFSYLLFKLFTAGDNYFIKSSGFWLGPVIFIGLGLLVGLLLSIRSKNRTKQNYVLLTATISCILFCLIIGSIRFYDWYYKRSMLNIEANEDLLNNAASYSRQQRIAFDMLTKDYPNSNDFRLLQISTTKDDTVIDKSKIDKYVIEFTYTKRNMVGKLFKSKYQVIDKIGYVQSFDIQLTNIEQFKIDSLLKTSQQQILRSTKNYTDTIQQ